VFRPKRQDISPPKWKVHIEELHCLYFSPNIFSESKSKWMMRTCSTHRREEKRREEERREEK
jgi:hypothetical protein